MAKGGSRAGGHRIPSAPSTRTSARPASSKDPDNGPAHPTSRKPTGGGGGNGGGQGNSNK